MAGFCKIQAKKLCYTVEDMEDAQIIELYWARDEMAIRETDTKYGSYCRAIAHRIVKRTEDTEECVSDTYLHTWNAIPPTRPDVLKLYLARIVRNLSFNRYKTLHALRRGGGEIEAALDELSECVAASGTSGAVAKEAAGGATASPQEEGVIALELRESINAFVKSLPERDGNLFLRRYFFTEGVREIAERYGLTENNVSVILNRTRKKLKEHLASEGYVV